MKTSVSELTTYSTELTEELEAYADAGFKAVELSLDKVRAHLSRRDPRYLRDDVDRLELVASGGVGFAPTGPSLLLASGAVWDQYLIRLRAELELCRALGIEVLGIGADARRWVESTDWRGQAIANLRTAAELAREHDVRLAIEYLSLGAPIGPFVLETLHEAKTLVDEADHPGLGLCIDFFHHFRGGGSAAELRALPGDTIANVHVTDVRDKERSSLQDADRTMPGSGIAPLSAYREAIVATGYDGYWTLELLDPSLWEQDSAVVSSLASQAMQTFVAGSSQSDRA